MIGFGIGLNLQRGAVSSGPPNIATTIVGTSAGVAAANSISIPAPSGHAAGDMLFYGVTTANTVVTPSGAVTALTIRGNGTAGSNGAQQVSTYWREATSGAEANQTFTHPVVDLNDYIYGFCIAVRGCPTGLNPVLSEVGLSASVAANPILFSAVTPTMNNARVIEFISNSYDNTIAQFINEVQAGGVGFTKLFDGGTNIGSGGGIAAYTWVKTFSGGAASTSVDCVSGFPAGFGRQSVVTRPGMF